MLLPRTAIASKRFCTSNASLPAFVLVNTACESEDCFSTLHDSLASVYHIPDCRGSKLFCWFCRSRMRLCDRAVIGVGLSQTACACRKAGKKRAADTKAKKAAERAQKQQENKAQQGCLDSGFSKVRQPYANECLQQVDQQCQKGVGTSRGAISLLFGYTAFFWLVIV